ncbi:uncharacterized protein LOC121373750 [Gigantopelta aegis]|uniref:uncharacterized protein LOC121373750 n=1 Tax=Gigantopelta aegis TaxID=1735272 RepID=UPI001B88CFAA|nr:uncharacterized protein LOC121373750 [Gigantopelta aegis]
MESSDPSQRGVYFPMELLPRDILHRLGNVRVLVVPKERSSSCKENEEECFGKKEDRNLFDGPPVSPGVNYRPMGQSFDFRLTSPEGERYPMKERQEAEMMKGLTETTPKRRPQEPLKTPVRFENNMAEDSRKSANQSPPCIPDGSHPSEIGVQAKIKRQLFSNFEADFRTMRTGKSADVFRWGQPQCL